MKLLAKERQQSCGNAKICYICRGKFEGKYYKSENHHHVRDHCQYTGEYRAASHSICNSRYSLLKEILKLFRNGWKSVCHFIIKELAE